jgi:hypothetical protein
MNTTRSIAIFCFLALLSAPFNFAQVTPKEHYKKAEELLKQNQVLSAYYQFRLAAFSDPSSKKYQKKLLK